MLKRGSLNRVVTLKEGGYLKKQSMIKETEALGNLFDRQDNEEWEIVVLGTQLYHFFVRVRVVEQWTSVSQ